MSPRIIADCKQEADDQNVVLHELHAMPRDLTLSVHDDIRNGALQ